MTTPHLDPYPASFGTVDPVPRLTPQRRAEIEARAAFFDSPILTLDHNTVADSFTEQMARINVPQVVTIVTARPEGVEHG